MAKPRVFVSSTYYDLKHIRSSLEIFIKTLGYDPILSEKGDIAYIFDQSLDESCYREARDSDIYVLIIGGRYGSEASSSKDQSGSIRKEFYDQYESITKKEYENAQEKGVPTFILIDKNVYAEYQTFRKNRENSSISYAHVDSVNVFYFIEFILAQNKNNPVQSFEGHGDIEEWLREQWAGLLRELIQRASTQQQLKSLSTQVSQLSEIGQTMKKYLEEILKSGGKVDKAEELIDTEEKRLDNARRLASLQRVTLFRHITAETRIEPRVLAEDLLESTSLEDWMHRINRRLPQGHRDTFSFLVSFPEAANDFEVLCSLIGHKLPPIE